MKLADTVTLVTGGNRGIGRAVATLFAREGSRVLVAGRDVGACEAVCAELSEARPLQLDVTDDALVEQAAKQAVEAWGQVDILVNCAGIIQYRTPVWQTSIADWDQMMAVNLRGTFLVCHHLAPHMVERGSGRIINLASSSARMADDDLGPYTASKWGVAGYTTSLARSLRPHGVRVNGVNPGWVDTDMSRAFEAGGDPEWSTPDEIARAILYLATDAPRDMTGQFLDIFGS